MKTNEIIVVAKRSLTLVNLDTPEGHKETKGGRIMKYFCQNCLSVWSGRDYNNPSGRIRKHVNDEGHHCPHCGSLDIIGGKEKINRFLSMDKLSLKDFEYGKGV